MATIHLEGADVTGLLLSPRLTFARVGSGLSIAPNTNLVLARVLVHDAGTAGGVVNTAQRVGAALGIAIVGVVLFHAALRQSRKGKRPVTERSPALDQAEAALVASEFDEAGAEAPVSLAASVERLAQTAADLVEAFATYLVLAGHNRYEMWNITSPLLPLGALLAGRMPKARLLKFPTLCG